MFQQNWGGCAIPLFLMRDNDWEVAVKVYDLEAAPRHRSLRCVAESQDVELLLKFRNIEEDEYRSERWEAAKEDWQVVRGIVTAEEEFDKDWGYVSRIIRRWPALLVMMETRLAYPFTLRITDQKMIDSNECSLQGGRTVGIPVAIHWRDAGTIGFGELANPRPPMKQIVHNPEAKM